MQTSRHYDEREEEFVTHKTTHYSPDVTYKYSIGGKEYTGRKFRTLGFSSKRENEIKELVDKYPSGSKIMVFYNPEKKEEAVIEKAPAPSKKILVFGGVVIVVGFLIVFVLSKITEKLFDMITSSNSNAQGE